MARKRKPTMLDRMRHLRLGRRGRRMGRRGEMAGRPRTALLITAAPTTSRDRNKAIRKLEEAQKWTPPQMALSRNG